MRKRNEGERERAAKSAESVSLALTPLITFTNVARGQIFESYIPYFALYLFRNLLQILNKLINL